MSKLLQVVYISAAIEPFDEQALNRLLADARNANQAHHISGLLLHHDGQFMQALEGPAEAVEQLLANIRRDERHTGFIELIRCHVDKRHFGDWSMASPELSPDDIEGYSDFFHEHTSNTQPSIAACRARALLESFRKSALKGPDIARRSTF